MRADKFFAGKYGSRTKAQEILKAGLILRAGKPLLPKDEVTEGDVFLFLDEGNRFVSAGGKKLEKGLSFFSESVSGEVAVDLGASTGGFTQCLLRRGAKRVFCVDVGESQLDKSLLSDERVVVMDRTNARYLTAERFSESVSVVTGDLSFISLRLIVPAICSFLQDGGRAFLLFKPQFECEGKGLGDNGILPVKLHKRLLSDFYDFCLESGLIPQNIVNAPIVEKKNVEYVIFLRKGGKPLGKDLFLKRAGEISD